MSLFNREPRHVAVPFGKGDWRVLDGKKRGNSEVTRFTNAADARADADRRNGK